MDNEQDTAKEGRGRARIVHAGLRLLGFVALWLVLTRGQFGEAWYIGAATVLLATYATYWIGPGKIESSQLMRTLGLVRFVPYFVRRSVLGAADVARRAFSPSRPLAPQLVDYTLRMRPESSATIAFVGVISLLPGTLCAGRSQSSVTVHVIDRGWPIYEQLGELEEKVAAVFGEPLERADDSDNHSGGEA